VASYDLRVRMAVRTILYCRRMIFSSKHAQIGASNLRRRAREGKYPILASRRYTVCASVV